MRNFEEISRDLETLSEEIAELIESDKSNYSYLLVFSKINEINDNQAELTQTHSLIGNDNVLSHSLANSEAYRDSVEITAKHAIFKMLSGESRDESE